MKPFLIPLFRFILLWLVVTPTLAQTPPGWGWVNKLGTYVPNTTNQNGVAGLGRDAAGNLYLLGTYVGTPVLGGAAATNAGESDVFLAKYSPAGMLLWLRLLQSAGVDQAKVLTVEPSGRCTLAGFFGSGPTGGNLAFTGFNSSFTLGGPALFGLPTTPLGYQSIPFVAAVDATGALLWADVPSPTYGVGITAMQRDNVGNCYVSVNMYLQSQLTVDGRDYQPIGSNDAALIKYTATGQPAWARRVGVSGGYGYSGDVYIDNANAVYWLVGHNNGTMTIDQVTVSTPTSTGALSLVKLSATNRVRWVKNDLLQVGSANAVTALLGFDAATNALYLSGGSNTGGGITYPGGTAPVAVMANATTTCVARCDTAGQVQWVKPVFYATNVPGGLPGPRGSAIYEFKAQGTGFTLVTRTVDFNATTFYGSTRTYGLAEGGLPCVAQFNTTTNQPDWVRTGGTPSVLGQNTFSEARKAAIDASGNVYLAGTFAGTAQFGATTLTSTSPTQQEMFLAKLDQSIVASSRAASGQQWSVFPNPTTGAVQLLGLPPQARVRAYDTQGRVVRELMVVGNAASLAGLAPGLYLLQVSNTAVAYRGQRLLVQ